MPGKQPRWSRADRRYMEMAFEEARQVKGKTLPNPPVGAVLVRAGRVVGKGGTRRAGEAHAEIVALEQAGKKARGSTLYVTLEPCNHHGRTPPCAEALIAAGVRRVIAAVRDPNPLAGGGLRRLRRAGVEAGDGLMAEEAAGFYADFFFFLARGRPRIHLKIAQSLDGRINARPGERTPITGAATKAWVHGLRSRVDAVVIGGGTLRCDNPDLTPRIVSKVSGSRMPNPEVVVLSRKGPFPDHLRVLSRRRRAQTVVLSESAPGLPPWVIHEPLVDGGGRRRDRGKAALKALLELFRKRGYHSVLVEGGRDLWALFLNNGVWDSLSIVTAPKLLPEGERWDAALDRGWGSPLKFHKFAFFEDDFMVEFGNSDS